MMKKLLVALTGMILLAGCAGKKAPEYDYTALKESKPKSILVVMPVNNSVDAKADTSVLARASYQLAEKGYYVYPVALVKAVVNQVIDTSKDKGYEVSAFAMSNLVHLGKNGGLLVGPHHPSYNLSDKK